jgi:hypothetical protein
MVNISRIFNSDFDPDDFVETSLQVFEYQYKNNSIYRLFSDLLHRNPDNATSLEDIPFLPISFFKTHKVVTGDWNPETVFESSGTAGMQQSKHYIKDTALYEKSFTEGFRYFYGDPKEYCFLALLPSYIERQGSSLIYMMKKLMEQSGHSDNGFYLHEHEALKNKLLELDRSGQKTILWGVTYALLDFSENQHFHLKNTIVFETGGMKGKRKEITRDMLHRILTERFGVETIHSEYGMAELLSQTYSKGSGLFQMPAWMKIMIREIDDPLSFAGRGATGGVNVIDLANIHSCSFIATQDLGKLYSDNSFEILGRFDVADMRGCNLLID